MFTCLHTADLHFSNNAEKLAEIVTTTNAMLAYAELKQPSAIVIAGDSLDEFDGRIRIDSDCARAAISFIERAADIAPVVVVRGTRSHDREAPYLFAHLKGKHPIHVATDVEMVALIETVSLSPRFVPVADALEWDEPIDIQAVLTLVPSLDKSQLMGMMPVDTIKSGNFEFRQAVYDLFAGFGLVNATIKAPKVLVTHGMVTGAQFSTGQVAVGEDLEFSLNDLRAAKCDAVMLGHVHKAQSWGEIAYCGSPARLNFGEVEDKSFLMWEFSDTEVRNYAVPTPARRFVFGELSEWTDANNIYNEAVCMARDCKGAFVRLRYVIPEEERNSVDRSYLESLFADAAAVKIEVQVIPKQRVRAAGISGAESLAAKVLKWGETVGEEVPESVLKLASVVEGMEVDELLDMAVVRPVTQEEEQECLFKEAA